MSHWYALSSSLLLATFPADVVAFDACAIVPVHGHALLQYNRTRVKASIDSFHDIEFASEGRTSAPPRLGRHCYGELGCRQFSALMRGHNETTGQRPLPRIRLGGNKRTPRGTAVSRKSSERSERSVQSTMSAPPCKKSVQVTARSYIGTTCDDSCPFWAEEVTYGRYCSFQCVNATECVMLNPATPIADMDWGYCRGCTLRGCEQCIGDGGGRCARCAVGYYEKNGECEAHPFLNINWTRAVLIVIAGLLLIGFIWLVDLECRPVTNSLVLAQALALRSRSKLHMCKTVQSDSTGVPVPPSPSSSRQLWPLTTNLLTTPVAGPGFVLHFRFQVAIIIWSTFVAIFWALVCFAFDGDLFILGRRDAFTPFERCVVITWGHATQERLWPVKLWFIFSVYFLSFGLALVFAVFQSRQFHTLTSNVTTMVDFALECEGLPPLDGSEDVEKELRQAIQDATGEVVVDISVCWDYADHADVIEAALLQNLKTHENLDRFRSRARTVCKESASGKGTTDLEEVLRTDSARRMCGQGVFSSVEKSLISFFSSKSASRIDVSGVQSVLHGLRSSHRAFVVFPTVGGRQRALRSARQSHGVRFRDGVFKLKRAKHAPSTVLWRNYTADFESSSALKLCAGALWILIALAIWTLFFYVPFNYFILYTYAASVQSPGIIEFAVFSSAIVLGNSFMYTICGEVAQGAGFYYNDQREMAYTVMYTIACLFNVLLDLISTYLVLFRVMADLGVRTHDGIPLAKVDTFQSRFEAYGMQRALGENLLTYAFPSTFLAPFLMEPIFYYVTFWILSRVIGSHREIKRLDAENYFECRQPDLSRYSDICVDVAIATLVFFFPGGYVLEMFGTLAACHLFVFLWDTYKLLRCSQTSDIDGFQVDLCAQAILAIPCGILLTCGTQVMLRGRPAQTIVCICVFVLHVTLHWILLAVIYHEYHRKLVNVKDASYAEIANCTPCNWFSANPVHCLRSKYIHGDTPPCQHFLPGKEHLLRANSKRGMHFVDEGYLSSESARWLSISIICACALACATRATRMLDGGLRWRAVAVLFARYVASAATSEEYENDAERTRRQTTGMIVMCSMIVTFFVLVMVLCILDRLYNFGGPPSEDDAEGEADDAKDGSDALGTSSSPARMTSPE